MTPPSFRLPDPRQYWPSDTGAGHYYRDLYTVTTGPDGITMVPPQTAPTPAGSLAAYFASEAQFAQMQPVPTQPAPSRPTQTQPAISPPAISGGRDAPPHRAQQQGRGPERDYRRNRSCSRSRSRGRRYSDSPPRYQEHQRGYGRDNGQGYNPQQQAYAQRQQNDSRNDNYSGRSFAPRGWAVRGNAGYNHREATRGAQQRRYSPVASANRGTTRLRAANATDMVPFTPKPPPSLADAERDARGHPLFPLPDNVSEYLGSDDSSESAAIAAKSLRASEMVRIAKLGPRTEPPAPVPEDAAAVGAWHGLTVQSRPDGRNMLQWNDAGCPFTRAKVLHIIAHWKARPHERRPAGIAYLMLQESTSRERFLLATTGKPFEKKRKSKAAIASASGPTTGASARSGSSSASAQLEEDAEMPAVPPAVETPRCDGAAPYLGLSPSGNDVGVVNSRTLLSDAVEHWAKIPTKDWYAGMCNDAGEYPRKEYERPNVGDVRSVVSLAVFIANPGFEETSLTMFSCAGMFARFVRDGAYKLALRGPERFEFETKDCGWLEAAAWWMCHGLSPVSEDTRLIESFACSWRNRLAGGEIPGNIIFTEYPTDPGCASTLSSADVVPWNMLVFPKLVDGRASSFPQDVSSASAEVLPLGPILDEDDSMGVEKEDRVDWGESDIRDSTLPPLPT